MAKKKDPFNQEMVIRGAIRRTFARAPIKQEVLKEGRREVPWFKKDGTQAAKPRIEVHCQVCNNWVPLKEIDIDHIEPVLNPELGFTSWDDFVKRLYCSKDNLQRCCSSCHSQKTQAENLIRRISKDRKLITELELKLEGMTREAIKKSVAKFTDKKLKDYPEDLATRIRKIKELVRKK